MQQNLIQLTDEIWLWPHNPSYLAVESAVGIIHCGTETVLIDAGNSPQLAKKIESSLDEFGFPPISQIIYTHHHWDHTFGACAFNAPVVAHQLSQSILLEEAKKPWSAAALHQQINDNPKLKVSFTALERAVGDWEEFHIVVPNITFPETLSLQCGNIQLELEHVGGQHAEDSIVIRVPHAGVIFLGDCHYPPPLHLQTSKPKPDLQMLESLESEDYSLYVSGHEKPLTREILLRRFKLTL
jgi:glyoxylase-like metal-dependent hydrolase (beta-lactamase superfamily II)